MMLPERVEMPFDDAQMSAWGYLSWRCLEDGTVLAVGAMLFGNGRLYMDVHAQGYVDCYCYDSVEKANVHMLMFDPASDQEPCGWKRHPATGRRRPEGDPAREYVAI